MDTIDLRDDIVRGLAMDKPVLLLVLTMVLWQMNQRSTSNQVCNRFLLVISIAILSLDSTTGNFHLSFYDRDALGHPRAVKISYSA